MSQKSFRDRTRHRATILLRKLVQQPRILLYKLLSDGVLLGRPSIYQPLQVSGRGTIILDDSVKIGCFPSPHFFSSYSYLEARNQNARIVIGADVWINNAFTAVAEHTSISIGARALIGTNVEIYDSDFHGLLVGERGKSEPAWAKPVMIEEDVFIGSNVKILKGARIGKGAVVANSSVVVGNVPPSVVVAGVPARVVRRLDEMTLPAFTDQS